MLRRAPACGAGFKDKHIGFGRNPVGVMMIRYAGLDSLETVVYRGGYPSGTVALSIFHAPSDSTIVSVV